MKAWWRRNLWALVALPVLLVALGAPDAEDLYHRYLTTKPTDPIIGAPHQTVHFGGADITLIGVRPASPTPPFSAEAVAEPAGYRFYQADLHFSYAKPDNTAGGCHISLVDVFGREFSDGPDELELAGVTSGTCEDLDNEKLQFDTTVYFRLPLSAEPAAILITREDLLPHYVRLLTG
jgi:hypothetical protein